jgi:Tfp pilus assembly protein PilF
MNDELTREEAERLLRDAYRRQMAGRLDEAADLYRRSIATHPTAEAHTFLGWTYSFQHRYAEAIEQCRLAIQVDPDFGNPYNDIGAYLIELGRPQEAVPWLQKAKRARRYEPRHFPCVNLARVYVQLCRFDEAKTELNEALALVPDYEPAQRMMAGIVAKMN